VENLTITFCKITSTFIISHIFC